MNGKPIYPPELETAATSLKQAIPNALSLALAKSLGNNNRALNEVQRLRTQRRILASTQLQANRSRRLDHRDLVAYASEVHRLNSDMDIMTANLKDHQTAILHLGEHRDHLQAELAAEKAAALANDFDLRADLQSCREEALRLSLENQRLSTQRRILASALRSTLLRLQSADASIDQFCEAFGDPLAPFKFGARGAVHAASWIYKQVQRALLTAFFGWRGARQVMEALNG